MFNLQVAKCRKVRFHTDRNKEERYEEAVTDTFHSAEKQHVPILHHLRQSKSGDEGSDHEVDTEKFSDDYGYQDHQHDEGDESVVTGLKIFLQKFSDISYR